MSKIMVVDDEADQRMVCSTLLEHFGYEMLEARDGAEAVQMAQEKRPDLILMDLGMPVMTGWDARVALQFDPLTAHIPVIAFSGYARKSDYERAQELGFDGYLSRPCSVAALLEMIRRFIPRIPEA